MAKPLRILILQERRFLPGDYLQLEVEGAVQPDRVEVWASERRQLGFGHGRFGTGRFGYGRSLGFGVGPFGRGIFGQGARFIEHHSSNSFPGGDYTLRMRSVDRLGNIGAWSVPFTHRHRPRPPKPTNLRITSGSLTWSWSDP